MGLLKTSQWLVFCNHLSFRQPQVLEYLYQLSMVTDLESILLTTQICKRRLHLSTSWDRVTIQALSNIHQPRETFCRQAAQWRLLVAQSQRVEVPHQMRPRERWTEFLLFRSRRRKRMRKKASQPRLRLTRNGTTLEKVEILSRRTFGPMMSSFFDRGLIGLT